MGKSKFLKIITIFLSIFAMIFVFAIYPWFKSKINAETVKIAKQDKFIQLIDGAELEFIGQFDGYNSLNQDDEIRLERECSIIVYKVNEQVANYLAKTQAKKEVDIFLDQYLKHIELRKNAMEENKEYKGISYESYDILINDFKKYRVRSMSDMDVLDRLSINIPEFYLKPKFACLFDHDSYDVGKVVPDNIFDRFSSYFVTKFRTIYPYQFFKKESLENYKLMIQDRSGFYFVIHGSSSSSVYIVQPRYQRIFILNINGYLNFYRKK